MGSKQGNLKSRYVVVPRTLIFLFHEEKILLLEGSKQKRLFPGYWNGIGGHVERDEDIQSAALRELKEEAGIQPDRLSLVGVFNIDVEEKRGVCVFIFRGVFPTGKLPPTICSPEGKSAWIDREEISHLNLVPDLLEILPRVIHHKDGDDPFFIFHKEGEEEVSNEK